MDMIDLRDVIENRESDPEAYAAWSRVVMEALGDTLEWLADNEPCMIREGDFVEHAQQLADDIGLTSPNDPWPLSHIDWKAAAKALKRDYASIEVDGRLYYYRNFGLDHRVGHFVKMTAQYMNDSTPIRVAARELPRHTLGRSAPAEYRWLPDVCSVGGGGHWCAQGLTRLRRGCQLPSQTPRLPSGCARH